MRESSQPEIPGIFSDSRSREGESPLSSPAIELARAAATGDTQAIARLLREVSPRVHSVVRAVVGSAHADVDDLVQQSLITLIQALPNFRGECEPAGYASRIAVRVAVAARKRSRLLASRVEPMDENIPQSKPSPQDMMLSAKRTELVRELLETIPEEQAECLALRVVLGFSLEDVAKTCDVPINTVRSRVRLAKEALRKRIEADPLLAYELEVSP